MNAGRLATCPRLRRVFNLLDARGPRGATTREIVAEAQVMAVSAVVAELRQNGVQIECEYQGRTEQGGRVYRYWLVGGGQGELFA